LIIETQGTHESVGGLLGLVELKQSEQGTRKHVEMRLEVVDLERIDRLTQRRDEGVIHGSSVA
jgi:hypothetical protein